MKQFFAILIYLLVCAIGHITKRIKRILPFIRRNYYNGRRKLESLKKIIFKKILFLENETFWLQMRENERIKTQMYE